MKIIALKDCKWSFNPSIKPSVFDKDKVYDLSLGDASGLVNAGYAQAYLEKPKEKKMHSGYENKMMGLDGHENKQNKKKGRPKKIIEEKQ